MRERLLKILACPLCRGALHCEARKLGSGGEIISGGLECRACSKVYPIIRSIPRFVGDENYTASFGYQWNRFRLEQVDSRNGLKLSETRFYSETEWAPNWLDGKWIMEAGCGAGRFLDIASRSKGDVVGVDLSASVEAAAETFYDRQNVHLVQASLFELPFRVGAFDGCYCIGVIQHTPDPPRALAGLAHILKPGGKIAVTIYERKPWTTLSPKYLFRPFTTLLPLTFLLRLIQCLMPFAFPLTEILFRIPLLSRAFIFMIPVSNYVQKKELSWLERYQWAVLDTFDAFSPAFDLPQTASEVRSALAAGGITSLRRLDNPGVNIVGIRAR